MTATASGPRLAVDIGGTFTDVVLELKVPIPPAAPPPPTVIVYVLPYDNVKGVSVAEFLPEVSEA